MDSKTLLSKLKADNADALKNIFYSYHGPVFQTILRIVNESNTAEDLAQEVFVRLWEKRYQLEIQGEFGPYLRRMAINEALGYLRKNKKYSIEDIDEQFDLSSESSSDAQQAHSELKEAVGEAMNKLPPKCRLVFSLSRFDGLSYKEIGEQMNISIKTVENQMGKALKIMRELLRDYLPSLIVFFMSGIGAYYVFCISLFIIATQLFF
jgi:RNA polymerase sigma-70 factor (ECF subfamily)